MNTNVFKAGMGILAAMMIGGAILAGTPRTPAAEACVLRAQESGACVIRGSSPADHLPLEGKAWTEEYHVEERLAVGILPEKAENVVRETAEAILGSTSSVSRLAAATFPRGEGKKGDQQNAEMCNL